MKSMMLNLNTMNARPAYAGLVLAPAFAGFMGIFADLTDDTRILGHDIHINKNRRSRC